MRVTCLGAAGTVTGSNYLVEADGVRILVDCGMFQGGRQQEELNRVGFAYDPGVVSHVLLTHAHIDHSGLIPKLVKDGFTGAVLCTPATGDLCSIMLGDSGHIQEIEAEWQNRKKRRAGRGRLIEPLYTRKDGEEALKCFRPVKYGTEIQLAPNARACFRDAGHILGSAMIELWLKEGGREVKLVFSGDLGSGHQPIIQDPTRIKEADLVFIESTYGNRLHKSRENTYKELREVIRAAHADNGNVIIPAFAVERTQEVLYVLSELYREGEIPHMDVYVDSPMAISATKVFLKHPECFDPETLTRLQKGDDPLDFPGMRFTRATEESMKLNEVRSGAIIISASGMAHAGRIKHHLRHNLWRKEAHIVFVGYQAMGTTGRSIVDGARTVKIFGEPVAVHAKVHTIGGFSAHADQNGLLKWLASFDPRPKAAVIVHGEVSSSAAFAALVSEKLGIKTLVPERAEVVHVEAAIGEVTAEKPAAPAFKFDAEMERSWEHMDRIVDRLAGMDDLEDREARESLSAKLHQINAQLEEIRDYLAGKEVQTG